MKVNFGVALKQKLYWQSLFLFISPIFLSLMYCIGLSFLAQLYHKPWQQLIVFPPEPLGSYGVFAALSQWMVLLATFGLIWFVPGVPLALAFAPRRWSRLTILLAGSLLNFALMVGITTLLKVAGYVPLTRASFLTSWIICLAVGMLILFQRRHRFMEAIHHWQLTVYHWRVILFAALLVILVGLVGYPKFVIENFNGDGTEVFAPAESLRVHFLPYWDLETKPRFGLPIVQPYWSYHYLMLPWLLLLGSSEAAVRLPLLGILALLFLTSTGLLKIRDKNLSHRWLSGYLVASILFPLMLLMYYGGHDSHVADTAHGATYIFLALLVVLQVYCLEQQNGGLFVILALLAIGTKYWASIFPLALLSATGWRIPNYRAWIGRLFGGLVGGVTLIALLAITVAWQGDYLHLWIRQLVQEFGHVAHWPWENFRRLLGFLFQWLLLSCVIPLFSLVFMLALKWRAPSTGQVVGLATIAYGGWLACIATEITFHARVLLGFLTMLAGGYGFKLHLPRTQRILGISATAVTAGMTLLAFPITFPASTANRELGHKTCMFFSSYEEAMAHARIADQLFEQGWMGSHIDYSAWVHYATITERPSRPYLYYLTSQPLPPLPGAVLVAGSPRDGFFFAATPEAVNALRHWVPRPRPQLTWLPDR